MPRRLAVVISQAAGLAGTPDVGHCSSAASSASCARSSASSTSRVIRVRAPTSRADSARHAVVIASAVALLGWHVRSLRGRTLAGRAASGPVKPCWSAPGQASAASGGASEIWRRVATMEHSGQYLACRSANSSWPAMASSSVSYCRMANPPTTSLASA